MNLKQQLSIIFFFIVVFCLGCEATAQQDYEDIYSLNEIRCPHLVSLTKWGDEYVGLFEPANGKVSHRSCTFENVHITPPAQPESVVGCLFVEKSEIVDARHLGDNITFKYSHDNARENKSHSTFQRGTTTASTFNLALKASEPISGVGIDIGASRTATTTRQTTHTTEDNQAGKDQVSFDVTFPSGGLYLLSTLHLVKKRYYPTYSVAANMTVEIEYVDEKDAKIAYGVLTKETCFKSVFLSPGIDRKTLKRLVLRGDVDNTVDQDWMFYGPVGDSTQTEDTQPGTIKLRKFLKSAPRNERTFLADVVTSLNLIKRVNDPARVDPSGWIEEMIPGMTITPSLAQKIAGYM